jgi:hypothetical protein
VVAGQQVAVPVRRDHDCAGGQVGVGSVPEFAVVSPVDPAPAHVSLLMEALVEFAGKQGSWCAAADRDRVAVGAVVGSPAGGTGTVSGGEGDGIVEEEQRSPAVGPGQRPAPVAVPGEAGDPEGAAVVAHDVLVFVDHAATVAGEQAAIGDGVKIAPGVDPVAARAG